MLVLVYRAVAFTGRVARKSVDEDRENVHNGR